MARRIRLQTSPRLVTLLVASLILNILLVIGIVVTYFAEKSLEGATMNYAIEVMCSDEYRQKYESQITNDDIGKKRLALVDYLCAKNGAQPYFEKGYNDYIRTLGLNP